MKISWRIANSHAYEREAGLNECFFVWFSASVILIDIINIYKYAFQSLKHSNALTIKNSLKYFWISVYKNFNVDNPVSWSVNVKATAMQTDKCRHFRDDDLNRDDDLKDDSIDTMR